MRDIRITLPKTQEVIPALLGKTDSDGLRLYQKILVLLLSNILSAYRIHAGTQLVSLLEGANTPPDQLLISLGTMACNQVKRLLATLDILIIKSLSANAYNGHLRITLTLKDGESYSGVLT